MSTTDPIGVLTSTRPVIDDAIWVEIDRDRVDVIAQDFAGRRVEPEEWASPFHYNDGTPSHRHLGVRAGCAQLLLLERAS